MTTMKSLAYFSLLAALATGCDVKQDLGETASGSSTGGGSGTGSGDTGAVDTGPWSGTGVSTGGSESDSEGTTSIGTGVLDTGPWWETSSGTGSPGDCETSGDFVLWDANSVGEAALGYEMSILADGTCTASTSSGGGTITVSLDCMADGERDGEAFVGENLVFDLSFELAGAAAPDPIEGIVELRLFVDGLGFAPATERFVVLEQEIVAETNAPVLIASTGYEIAPRESDVDPVWPDGWYAGPSFVVTDPLCESGLAPDCGGDMAIEAGWVDETPIVLGATETDRFSGAYGGFFDLYVETAWLQPDGFSCGDDAAHSGYAFVAWLDQ